MIAVAEQRKLQLRLDYAPSIKSAAFHASRARFRFLIWGVKSGKCILRDQKVLLADGSKKAAEDLKVGDRLLGCDRGVSNPIRVTAIEPAQKECAEVTFADGSVIRCSMDHRFPVWNYKLKRQQIKTLTEILHVGKRKERAKYKFLKPALVNFEASEPLPVEPYFLGLLLGDGGLSAGSITFSTSKSELLAAVQSASAEWGLVAKQSGPIDYRLSSQGRRDHRGYNYNPLISQLREMGLFGCKARTKFIPPEYLHASAQDRLRLLAGLIDTDGYVYNKGRMIEYCTMSEKLASGVQSIVRSLGGFCSIRRGHVGQYRLGITINRAVPCRVPYKKLAEIKRDKTRIGVSTWHEIGMQDCIHISVDAENELFLLDNYVATHNTAAGIHELARVALAQPGPFLSWIVTPSYTHVQLIERELVRILNTWAGMVVARNRNNHEIELRNGGLIQTKSADWPDGLRGPNVDFLWVDEASYVKQEAWWILLERIAATEGDVVVTTTPHGRNWLFQEVRMAGMPMDAPYGVFDAEDGDKFVSHFPTWEFPWVKQKEIDSAKARMPFGIFEQEYGAKFLSDLTAVFRYIDENMTRLDPPEKIDEPIVMGVDLAKAQDYSAIIIMGISGRIYHIDRWHKIDWTIQRARIENLSKEWGAPIVLDRSNIGSVIEEDLRNAGCRVTPVDMNSHMVKLELVQTLQISFERKRLKIPNPQMAWAPRETQNLLDELEWFECTITKGGRPSYSAPQGLNDDLVSALMLANYGRVQKIVGGGQGVSVALARSDWDRAAAKLQVKAPVEKRYNKLFGRKSKLGLGRSGGPLWGPGATIGDDYGI